MWTLPSVPSRPQARFKRSGAWRAVAVAVVSLGKGRVHSGLLTRSRLRTPIFRSDAAGFSMGDEHGDEGNVASDAIDESADCQDEAPSLPARTATSALSAYYAHLSVPCRRLPRKQRTRKQAPTAEPLKLQTDGWSMSVIWICFASRSSRLPRRRCMPTSKSLRAAGRQMQRNDGHLTACI